MNIILVGFMGTGKTVVGRRVAERLGRPFFDADALLEKESGRSIAEWFEKKGEAAFREEEARILRTLGGKTNVVIAAGGGALLREDNRRALTREGRAPRIRPTT